MNLNNETKKIFDNFKSYLKDYFKYCILDKETKIISNTSEIKFKSYYSIKLEDFHYGYDYNSILYNESDILEGNLDSGFNKKYREDLSPISGYQVEFLNYFIQNIIGYEFNKDQIFDEIIINDYGIIFIELPKYIIKVNMTCSYNEYNLSCDVFENICYKTSKSYKVYNKLFYSISFENNPFEVSYFEENNGFRGNIEFRKFYFKKISELKNKKKELKKFKNKDLKYEYIRRDYKKIKKEIKKIDKFIYKNDIEYNNINRRI